MQLLSTGRPMPCPALSSSRGTQPAPTNLYAEHDMVWCGIAFWPGGVSCPGCAPSQLLVCLLSR